MKETTVLMVQEEEGATGRIKIYDNSIYQATNGGFERRFCTPAGDGIKLDKMLSELKHGDCIEISFPDVCGKSPDKRHCPHPLPPYINTYVCCWCGQTLTINPLDGHGEYHPDRPKPTGDK